MHSPLLFNSSCMNLGVPQNATPNLARPVQSGHDSCGDSGEGHEPANKREHARAMSSRTQYPRNRTATTQHPVHISEDPRDVGNRHRPHDTKHTDQHSQSVSSVEQNVVRCANNYVAAVSSTPSRDNGLPQCVLSLS